MRTMRFLFVVLSFGALSLRLSIADEPATAAPQSALRDKSAATIHPTDTSRINIDRMDREHLLLHGVGLNWNWSRQPRSIPGLTESTAAYESHRPAVKKAITAANQPFIVNKPTTYKAPPDKLPAGRETVPPLARVVPRRTAGVASLGGLNASTTKNSAAALNGTALKRKP